MYVKIYQESEVSIHLQIMEPFISQVDRFATKKFQEVKLAVRLSLSAEY